MFLITALQALFASSIPIGKNLLGMTSPVMLTGIRMFIAGFIMLAYNYFAGHANFRLKKHQIWIFLQVIFFGVYLRYILRYWGLAQVTVGKLSFLEGTAPFFAAFFSYLFLSEKLSRRQWLGFFIGCIGLIPIMLTSTQAEKLLGELFFFSWAELAILASVGCYSYTVILMRKLVRDDSFSASMTNGIRMFGGGLLALMTAGMFEGFSLPADPVNFLFWLSLLIILGNIICHNFYIHLLKYYSATFLQFTDFLCPVFASLYGWFFFHEIITWHYYASGIIIFYGLYLFYQDELQSISLLSHFNIPSIMHYFRKKPATK